MFASVYAHKRLSHVARCVIRSSLQTQAAPLFLSTGERSEFIATLDRDSVAAENGQERMTLFHSPLVKLSEQIGVNLPERYRAECFLPRLDDFPKN